MMSQQTEQAAYLMHRHEDAEKVNNPDDNRCLLCQTPGGAVEYKRYLGGSCIEGYCFTCSHFVNLLVKDLTPRNMAIIFDGSHYIFGPQNEENSPSNWRGCGGHRSYYYDQGKNAIYTSADAWHQGKIPEHLLPAFRSIMPTVTIISKQRYEELEKAGANVYAR